jgi:hypothetical protein
VVFGNDWFAWATHQAHETLNETNDWADWQWPIEQEAASSFETLGLGRLKSAHLLFFMC